MIELQNTSTISEELRREAVEKGMCKPWQDEWASGKDLDELCEMFKRGLKFCAYQRYPTADYIVNKFGEVAIRHGIYANQIISETNPKMIVAKGNSSGSLLFDNYSFGIVHVLDQSSLKITTKDHAVVWVYVYNDAQVDIDTSSINPVRVHQFMRGGHISHRGKVNISQQTYNPVSTNSI